MLLAVAMSLRIVRGVLPLVQVWIPKLLLDELVRSAGHISITPRLVSLLLWYNAAVAAGDLMTRGSAAVEGLLGERLSHSLNEQIMLHASTLDLAHFETPSVYDKLERARGHVGSLVALLTALLGTVQECITVAILLLGFITVSRWMCLLVVAATLPSFFHERRMSRDRYALNLLLAPTRASLDYLRWLLTSLQCMMEVRIYDLSQYIATLYRQRASYIYGHVRRLTIRRLLGGGLANLVAAASYCAVYVIAVRRVLAGVLSLGTFTFVSSSFARAASSVLRLSTQLTTVSENSLYLTDLFDFLALRPEIAAVEPCLLFPKQITSGIVFENVWFQYPGSSKPVLRNLNLRIQPGESIALTGENGSGKTTIVKLLARLYDPTGGRILLEGKDLRGYDPRSVQQNIGFVFQDFLRYEMSVRENIGFGHLSRLNDNTAIDNAVDGACCRDIIDRLPLRYAQLLGRRFEGGVGLSGGEWQRLAIARAWIREAQLLILDEPNMSLDARAEHEIFRRFDTIRRKRMVVLISHKFATARLADRIIFLRDGAVKEEGTHAHLLRSNGHYAELYALQASAIGSNDPGVASRSSIPCPPASFHNQQ